MAKGNNRKQKEIKKKRKKGQVKVSATANSLARKPATGNKKLEYDARRHF